MLEQNCQIIDLLHVTMAMQTVMYTALMAIELKRRWHSCVYGAIALKSCMIQVACSCYVINKRPIHTDPNYAN